MSPTEYSTLYAYVGWTVDAHVTGSRLGIWADARFLARAVAWIQRNRYSTNPGDLPKKAKWKQWNRNVVAA